MRRKFRGKGLSLAQSLLSSLLLVYPGPFWEKHSAQTSVHWVSEYIDGLGSVCAPSGGAVGQVGTDSGDLITGVTVTGWRDFLMVIDLSEEGW